jgi:hypothetical protein
MMHKNYPHIPQIMIDLVENSDARLKFPTDVDEVLMIGNHLLSKGKGVQLTEEEDAWFSIFNSLMIYSMNYQLENDSNSRNNMYEFFKSGKQHELSDDENGKKLFEDILTKNLIDSEEYEKVIELKKRNDGTNG